MWSKYIVLNQNVKEVVGKISSKNILLCFSIST